MYLYLWRWRPKKTAVLALSRIIFRILNKYKGRCGWKLPIPESIIVAGMCCAMVVLIYTVNPHKYLSNVAKRKIWQNVAIQLSVNICISNWHFRERYLYELVTAACVAVPIRLFVHQMLAYKRKYTTHRTFNLNSMCARWLKKTVQTTPNVR